MATIAIAFTNIKLVRFPSLQSSSSRSSLNPARCSPIQQVQVDSTIACEPCNGRGWILCDFCEGQKTNVKVENNRIYRRCPSCRAGVVGLVFGNENSASNEDSYVERVLDRISNGQLAEDRRTAMVELQSVVAESRASQLAFGAMGFPVILAVLKEERDDVEMVAVL